MPTCDACPAAARASAVVNDVTLHFCAHHFRRSEVALIVSASSISTGVLDAERFLPKEVFA